MKELLEAMYRELVDHPEDVRISTVNSGQSTIFELRAHPDDLGFVIGRKGRIASAVRTLLEAAGAKQHKRFLLEIIDGAENKRRDAHCRQFEPR